jgi:hypothetical protein
MLCQVKMTRSSPMVATARRLNIQLRNFVICLFFPVCAFWVVVNLAADLYAKSTVGLTADM